MLKDDFELSVVGTSLSNIPEETRDIANVFGGDLEGRVGEVKIIREYMQIYNPDILVQITNPSQHGLIAGTASKLKMKPFVYRYSGDSFNTYKIHTGWRIPAYYCLHNIAGKIPVKLADEHIVLGPHGQELLRRAGSKNTQPSILPPPIRRNRFKELSNSSTTNEKYRILYLGGDSYIKGFDRVRQLVRKCDGSDFEFILGGSFESVSQVANRENVQHKGYIHPERIPQELASADVLLITSRKEGLPRVILEAHAVGTPVISSDVGEVESVTNNIYHNENQLIDLLNSITSLHLPDPEEYFRENLKSSYVNFFDNIVAGSQESVNN